LVVLLAEHGEVGFDGIEQLDHDRGDTLEVARSHGSFESLGESSRRHTSVER
jgi:hypothetical protein